MRIFRTPSLKFASITKVLEESFSKFVETRTPIRLSAREKLSMLRHMDPRGNWESLHNKRQCPRCGAIFSGHKIDVVGGTRDLGPLRLLCPSDKCQSTAREWIFPGEELPGPTPEQAQAVAKFSPPDLSPSAS